MLRMMGVTGVYKISAHHLQGADVAGPNWPACLQMIWPVPQAMLVRLGELIVLPKAVAPAGAASNSPHLRSSTTLPCARGSAALPARRGVVRRVSEKACLRRISPAAAAVESTMLPCACAAGSGPGMDRPDATDLSMRGPHLWGQYRQDADADTP